MWKRCSSTSLRFGQATSNLGRQSEQQRKHSPKIWAKVQKTSWGLRQWVFLHTVVVRYSLHFLLPGLTFSIGNGFRRPRAFVLKVYAGLTCYYVNIRVAVRGFTFEPKHSLFITVGCPDLTHCTHCINDSINRFNNCIDHCINHLKNLRTTQQSLHQPSHQPLQFINTNQPLYIRIWCVFLLVTFSYSKCLSHGIVCRLQ